LEDLESHRQKAKKGSHSHITLHRTLCSALHHEQSERKEKSQRITSHADSEGGGGRKRKGGVRRRGRGSGKGTRASQHRHTDVAVDVVGKTSGASQLAPALFLLFCFFY